MTTAIEKEKEEKTVDELMYDLTFAIAEHMKNVNPIKPTVFDSMRFMIFQAVGEEVCEESIANDGRDNHSEDLAIEAYAQFHRFCIAWDRFVRYRMLKKEEQSGKE